MSVDHHKKPFDEGTIAKLDIFEDYAEAWLPTFVMAGHPRVAIFDLFAGPGYDANGNPGSSIRSLRVIKGQIGNILTRGVKVELHFNEFNQRKAKILKAACDEYLVRNPDVSRAVTISISSEDFDVCFRRLEPHIGIAPSLVYLDQSGIKAIRRDYFGALEGKTHTDFLYFVSSSYFWRFGDKAEFKLYLDIDLEQAKADPYFFVHRHVLDRIKATLPGQTKLKLHPFSIKKGANIYGIIFGATHVAAVEKFLRIAWKRNEINGEANFDIDRDLSKDQPDLWGEKPLTKLEAFERDVCEAVLQGKIRNNREALEFAYSRGHIGTHASDVLQKMRKESLISFEGRSPLVTYDKVFKEKRIIAYEVETHGSK